MPKNRPNKATSDSARKRQPLISVSAGKPLVNAIPDEATNGNSGKPQLNGLTDLVKELGENEKKRREMKDELRETRLAREKEKLKDQKKSYWKHATFYTALAAVILQLGTFYLLNKSTDQDVQEKILSADIRMLEATKSEVQQKIELLEMLRAEKSVGLAELQTRIDQREKQLEGLKGEIEKIERENRALKREVDESHADLKAAGEKLSDANRDYEKLARERATLAANIEGLKLSEATMKREIDGSKKELGELRDKYNKSLATIALLRSGLKEAKSDLLTLSKLPEEQQKIVVQRVINTAEVLIETQLQHLRSNLFAVLPPEVQPQPESRIAPPRDLRLSQ